MKHSKRHLEAVYDRLYRSASALLAECDPCQIRGKTCFSMRTVPEHHVNEPFCCTGCKYLGPKGCTVESLFCKLWVCEPIQDREKDADHPDGTRKSPLLEKLKALRREARQFGLMKFRGSKADSVKKALSGQLD